MNRKFYTAVAIFALTAVAAFGQGTNNVTTNTVSAVSSNSVATTGPITVIAGDAVGTGLTWIAQHGSAGAGYAGPLKGGKNGGTGPAVTETAWFLDTAWVSADTNTNIDFKVGLVHSDVVASSITVDQFGMELSESFFNANLVTATAKVPVLNVITRTLAKWDIEVIEAISENTDEISKARFSDEKADWLVGAKIVKLY
jgi:hypothetical protein